MRRWMIATASVVAWLVLIMPTAAARAEDPCESSSTVGHANRPSAPAEGAEIKPTVAFSSSGPAEPMNMGGLRGTGTTDIAIAASPALPTSVTSEEITVDIPKRFARNGPGLTTQYLPEPEFSKPRILQHGTLIAFTLCVNASHTPAGSYVGQVIVGGPKGVQPATIAVTLNAKDEIEFIVGSIVAGVIAVLLLLLRGIKVRMEKPVATNETAPTAGKALGITLKDLLGFWVPTIVAVAAALVAMLQVYDANSSWGADATSSLIALGGTALSAAGLGTFLSSLKGV
jgi:hypothetical protein